LKSPTKACNGLKEDTIDAVTGKSLSWNTTVGVAFVTRKYSEFDVPPPGGGFVTVIVAVPATAISTAPIAAVTCDPLTNVVARGLPFQFTTAPATNPVPFTVKVNASPPGATAVGFGGVAINGTGLFAARAPAQSSTAANAATTAM